MTEYYEGVSSLLSFKGDLKSNGTRYFSINNLTVFSKTECLISIMDITLKKRRFVWK